MKTLLFTGGGGAGTEALARLLADRYIVHFADADRCAKPPSVAHDRWHVIPYAADWRFVPELTRLCERLGVDVLIPGVDEELRHISTRTWPCDVLLPDDEFVETHLDKLASMRHLEERGIPVPITYRAVSFAGDPCWPEFPCVIKPRSGRGSRHVAVVNSPEEIAAHVLLSHMPAESFVTQERLIGQEYTVTLVADQSKRLRAVVPVRVHKKRGITLRAETDCNIDVIITCANIHREHPFSGCVNVQVIQAEDGTVEPFEINPRISTTACLVIASGVDIIALAYATDAPSALVPVASGVRLNRSWLNEFR